QVMVLENDKRDSRRPPTVFIQVMNMEEEAIAKITPSGSTAPYTLLEIITSGFRCLTGRYRRASLLTSGIATKGTSETSPRCRKRCGKRAQSLVVAALDLRRSASTLASRC